MIFEAEAQARAARERYEADERAAQLVARHPELVRLKELEVLREIGQRGGNHFYLGLERLVEGRDRGKG